VGILLGIGLIAVADYFQTSRDWALQLGLQDWVILDPIIAFLVAINIVWAGIHLLQRTASGLLDAALPSEEQAEIIEVLEQFVVSDHITYHALRTRYAGARRFVSVHILVPGSWTVQQGHDLVETIELQLMTLFDHLDIDTHLEPIEDQASWRH
jgi:divalent metal cation (Fe/Co/Zn/Cd) transporter